MSLYSPNHSKSPLFHTFSICCLDVHNSWVKVKCQDPQDPRFTFRISNTTFGGGSLGCGAICAGQHCGLGGAGRSGWPVPRWPVKMGDWSYWSLSQYGIIWPSQGVNTMGTYDYELLDQLDLNMDTPWIPHFWTKWCQDWWLHMALECSKLIQVARATCNTCWTVLTSPRHFGAGAAAERSPCHIRSWSRIISYNYIYI